MAMLAIAVLVNRFSASSSPSKFITQKFNHLSRRLPVTVSAKSPHQQHRSCKVMASLVTSALNKDVTEVAADHGKITAPYGSWKSPINADVVSGASKRLGGTAVDGHGRLIWLESRPTEGGYACYVIFCHYT